MLLMNESVLSLKDTIGCPTFKLPASTKNL